MGSGMVPFKICVFYEATHARLSTDTATDAKPTLTIGMTNGDEGAGPWRMGVLKTVGVRLNPTNAVTYTIEFYQDDSGATSSYQLRADCLFKSHDNAIADIAAAADDTEYVWHDINRYFYLTDIGDFFMGIDWSAAPGDTTGMVVLEGEREAFV